MKWFSKKCLLASRTVRLEPLLFRAVAHENTFVDQVLFLGPNPLLDALPAKNFFTLLTLLRVNNHCVADRTNEVFFNVTILLRDIPSWVDGNLAVLHFWLIPTAD